MANEGTSEVCHRTRGRGTRSQDAGTRSAAGREAVSPGRPSAGGCRGEGITHADLPAEARDGQLCERRPAVPPPDRSAPKSRPKRSAAFRTPPNGRGPAAGWPRRSGSARSRRPVRRRCRGRPAQPPATARGGPGRAARRPGLRPHRAPPIGSGTPARRDPSSKTASTWTSVTTSATPGSTSSGPSTARTASTASARRAPSPRGLADRVGDQGGGLRHVEPQPAHPGRLRGAEQQQPVAFGRGGPHACAPPTSAVTAAVYLVLNAGHAHPVPARSPDPVEVTV